MAKDVFEKPGLSTASCTSSCNRLFHRSGQRPNDVLSQWHRKMADVVQSLVLLLSMVDDVHPVEKPVWTISCCTSVAISVVNDTKLIISPRAAITGLVDIIPFKEGDL